MSLVTTLTINKLRALTHVEIGLIKRDFKHYSRVRLNTTSTRVWGYQIAAQIKKSIF